MKEQQIVKLPLSFGAVTIEIRQLDTDYHILVYGGSRPHLGCTVLTSPRPSLTGDGSVSCTSSVLNVPGHKDETVCRYLAEAVCRAKNAVVICSGGFHQDNISPEQIHEVMEAVKNFCFKKYTS